MSTALNLNATTRTTDARRRVSPWTAAGLAPLAVAAVAVLGGAARPVDIVTFTHVGVLGLLLAACTATDLRAHRIPNWATYTAALWALALAALVSAVWGADRFRGLAATGPLAGTFFVADFGPIGLRASFAGAAACFAVMCLVHYVAGSGAGDVKLATALGALLGAGPGLTVIVYCHIAAGAAVLAWLVWSTGPATILRAFARVFGSRLFPACVTPPDVSQSRLLARPVPMAAFFAIGTLLTVCKGIVS